MNILEAALSLIAPTECLSCSAEGASLCGECQTLLSPAPPQCFLCSVFMEQNNLCRLCAKRRSFKSLHIACEYTGLAKQLIHQLKFAYERDVARTISDIMSEEIVDAELPDSVIIVPVPTASSRVRQRSFDHMKLIARHLSIQTALPYANALQRTTQNRQVGKRRSQRLDFSESNFHISKANAIQGKPVLLIDDVLTTGATLQAAAKALRRAGAERIHAAVFAYKR